MQTHFQTRGVQACLSWLSHDVVFTPSFAVDGGKEDTDLHFNETSWGNPDRAKPYPKSKMLAEKRAWELQAEHAKAGGTTELCTVHPGAVFGPQITTSGHASADIMTQIVTKAMPFIPEAGLGIVDVRDVARIHVAAMTHPQGAGKRFMACESTRTLLDMAAVVDSELGPLGFDIPTGRAPDCLLRCVACCDPGVASITTRLGKQYVYERTLTDNVLQLQPWFPWDEAVASMARTLVQQGMVPDQSAGKVLASQGPQLPQVHLDGVMTAQEYVDASGEQGESKSVDGAAAAGDSNSADETAPAAAGEAKSVDGGDAGSVHSDSK